MVVVGAGPAGSTAAALLAGAGARVVLLERQRFPRFQIGESLLPVALPVLARLGVEPGPSVALYKGGAQFVCERTGRVHTFSFSQALAGCPPHAYQVDRSAFDALLCEHAAERGAQVREGVTVGAVTIADREVRVNTEGGPVVARYLIDATGQGRLLARQRGTVLPHPRFGRAAAYLHFDGVAQGVIDEFAPDNDIRILVREQGWGWIIPLPGARLSVGLVTRKNGIVGDVTRYVQQSPLVRRMTAGTRATLPRPVRSFSYRNTEPSGARFVCVGDAACFVDPLFSSGVSLGLASAVEACELLGPALERGREGDPELMQRYDRRLERATATFAALVERFYHTRFSDHFLFGARREEAVSRGIVSVLAGDVFRTDNPFQELLLGSRRKPWAVPAERIVSTARR